MLCTAHGSWQAGSHGSMCLRGAAGAGGSLVGLARAGDSVGTGVVDMTATAARLLLLACPHRLGQG